MDAGNPPESHGEVKIQPSNCDDRDTSYNPSALLQRSNNTTQYMTQEHISK